MSVSVVRGWTIEGAGGASSRASRPLMQVVRAVGTPANCVLAAAIVFGWLALVAWTGVGPGGWQARACSGLDVQPLSCAAVQPRKDETRVVPHASPMRSPA